MKKLGFIGLGTMGRPMALNLVKGGHTVYVYDVVAEKASPLTEAGAVHVNTAEQVAEVSDIVFIMVLTENQVESLIFGNDGIAEKLKAGAIVVCMSTLAPSFSRDLSARLAAKGVAMLDAPVSGGQAGATVAGLAIMVGGEKDSFHAVHPYLKLMGNNISLVGGPGCGQAAKGANQIIITLTRAAIGEAFLFAKRNNTDPGKVMDALCGGLADSASLRTYGPRITGDENPIKFDSSILKKDSNTIADAAKAMGIDLPFSQLIRTMYNSSEK